MVGCTLRFLDHIKNEDSPGPPVGSHHAFFSDDQEPYPVTDIADLIRDSYEVTGPGPIPPSTSWKLVHRWILREVPSCYFFPLYAKRDSVPE